MPSRRLPSRRLQSSTRSAPPRARTTPYDSRTRPGCGRRIWGQTTKPCLARTCPIARPHPTCTTTPPRQSPGVPRTRPNHLRARLATAASRMPHPAYRASLVPLPAYTHPRPPPQVPPSHERERPVGMRAGGSERSAPAIAMESPSPHCCTPYLSPLHPLLPRRLAVAPAVPPSPRPSPAHPRTPAAPAFLDVSPANAPSHLYRYKPNRYYSRLVRDLGRDWT
ncbi:hypothetical protein DFH09DRAFT_1372381 [Mycena vulgaris]|nr:hypothetical protein DFH09DRAFT_1372381 [Mycena vulgaris]